MSKPQPRSNALGRPRRTLPRAVRNTIAMVASHPGTTALGGMTGLMAGLVSGSIAGPAGAASGAALGCTIGAAAGAALAAHREELSMIDIELDRMIGVTEGNLGEARPMDEAPYVASEASLAPTPQEGDGSQGAAQNLNLEGSRVEDGLGSDEFFRLCPFTPVED